MVQFMEAAKRAIATKGPFGQIVRLFLVFPYTWQKDVAKMPKLPGTQRDVNPARQ